MQALETRQQYNSRCKFLSASYVRYCAQCYTRIISINFLNPERYMLFLTLLYRWKNRRLEKNRGFYEVSSLLNDRADIHLGFSDSSKLKEIPGKLPSQTKHSKRGSCWISNENH